jgi:hypothetical protein
MDTYQSSIEVAAWIDLSDLYLRLFNVCFIFGKLYKVC